MKRLKLLFALSFLFLLSFVSFSGEPDKELATLTVEVSQLRNSNGRVQCLLYNTEGSIPDEKFEKYYRIAHGEIANTSCRITFKNLPKGTYAVTVLHDENNNGRIDKRFFLPIEGIGFSNYQSLGISNRPSFEKASFEFKSDELIRVKVIYF
ncbi:MAG: DUF2141 domain-containing protein [Salinivirgaceae bacterium]|jgi:uncharacterized protein (DUF2141 family)